MINKKPKSYALPSIPVKQDLAIAITNSYAQWYNTSITQQKKPTPPAQHQEVLKESNMYEREYEQQKYLKSRLADVVDKKREDLADHFLLVWTDYPKTPAEFKQRVADGKFTWEFGNLKEDTELGYHGIGEWFSWRTQPADEKGYDAATEQLYKDATAVKDQAMLSYEDGLKALQQLEAKTYH